MILFFKLVIGHFFGDYVFQNQFMADYKSPGATLNGQIVWPWVLAAHSAVHAGIVWYLTGFAILGAFEFVCHMGIDYSKSIGKMDWHGDQFLHLLCKLAIVIVALAVPTVRP